MFTPHHMSHVSFHMWCVRCQVSCVMCQVTGVSCNFIYFFLGQSGGASRWRVCYQHDLPSLISYYLMCWICLFKLSCLFGFESANHNLFIHENIGCLHLHDQSSWMFDLASHAGLLSDIKELFCQCHYDPGIKTDWPIIQCTHSYVFKSRSWWYLTDPV